jgi:hypothetical protein
LRKELTRRVLAEQAERIIPVAAGHAVGLLQLFLRTTGAPT